MANKEEVRASIDLDFSKVEAKLREADSRQKDVDQKAEAADRRTARLVERMKEAQAAARELEARVGNRIEDMIKDFGKFTVKSVLFDTFSSFSGISSPDAGPLAGIATTALITGATTLNPIYAMLAAMGKTIDLLRDAQKDYQRQVEDLRKADERRELEDEKNRAGIRARNEEARFRDLQDETRIQTEVDQENNELLRKTWLLMGGGDN